MRIALVAPECSRRTGATRYVCELAEQVGGRHEVDVFSAVFEDAEPRRARHRPIRSHRRSSRLDPFTFLAEASQALRAERFDVVHGVGACCFPQDVLTAPTCAAAWDELVRTEVPSLAGGPLDAGGRRALVRVEKWVFASPLVRRVVVASRRAALDLERFYGRTDGVVVLPLGVDVDAFHPRLRVLADELRRALVAPEGAFLALFMGDPDRGNLRTLLEALVRTREERVHVLVASSEPERARALALELGVTGHVTVVEPPLPLERLLATADVLVSPALDGAFDTAPLDAAASGTPVLASSRSGFAEWLEDGRTGFVVEDPLDAAAFARRLDELARDPERASAMGGAGRRVAEGFSWRAVAEATERVYEEVAEEKAKARRDEPGAVE